MASKVRRWLFAAFLLVPAFVDAQTLAPDATPKAFLQVIDRPRAGLTPSQNIQREVNGIQHWHFTYAADEAQRVSGLLTKATNVSGKRPVVIALHGTGGSGGQFFGFVEALRQNELARLLAEPTLVTLDGRPANFNVGGQVPIPLQQALGVTTVTYRSFGTMIDFVPIVLGNGMIRLEVRPDITEIDPSLRDTVKAICARRASCGLCGVCAGAFALSAAPVAIAVMIACS